MEDGSLLECECAFLGAVDFCTGDVRRKQIRRKLNSMELGMNAVGQGFDGFGFGQAGGTLNQKVSVTKQGNEQPVDKLLLANDLSVEPFLKF